MAKEFSNVQKLFTSLKTEWERNRVKWIDIAKFVGITVDTNYLRGTVRSTEKKDLDQFIDDPTSALSVNQSGDYLLGIMWGTGAKVFDMIPSRYVTDLVDEAVVQDYYDFATNQALYHINHPQAGFHSAMQPYVYDQMSFGTSGIGCFYNKSFGTGVDENALIFNSYGVDNTVIDEGKSGQCDIVFTVYNWKVNRIVSEFGMFDGNLKESNLSKLPKPILDAYRAGDFNKEFKIVFGFYPRENYNPKLKGKRGTRYKGVWFMDDTNYCDPFFEEDFAERPISMARAIRVRGEVYGRAAGTLLIQSIKSVNFILGNAIEIIEKMGNPALGVFNNAIFGDNVLDSSPSGLTVFNQSLGAGGNPVFPVYDVGDPSAIIQFLVPYLNEKIVTGFKVDTLLDFSSAKEMTATESMQRYVIRGKSLSGFLLQQKNEQLVPICKRSISVLSAVGELGVNPITQPDQARRLSSLKKSERVIPDAVLQVMESGRPWYELRFNNELEKLTRTEGVENLLKLLQGIGGIAGMYPDIIQAVDWYKLLKDLNDNLDANNQILLSEKEFKSLVSQAAEQRAQMMQLQAGEVGSKATANMAKASKDNSEAQRGQ